MTKREFIEGYNRALEDWEKSVAPADGTWNPPNPFPEGTEANRGYEAGVYDLTQK